MRNKQYRKRNIENKIEKPLKTKKPLSDSLNGFLIGYLALVLKHSSYEHSN